MFCVIRSLSPCTAAEISSALQFVASDTVYQKRLWDTFLDITVRQNYNYFRNVTELAQQIVSSHKYVYTAQRRKGDHVV